MGDPNVAPAAKLPLAACGEAQAHHFYIFLHGKLGMLVSRL